jgi:hypothetical protein
VHAAVPELSEPAASAPKQMSSTEGAKLVRAVITRLAQEGEEDWFGWVCCELTVQVGQVPPLTRQMKARTIQSSDEGFAHVGPGDAVCAALQFVQMLLIPNRAARTQGLCKAEHWMDSAPVLLAAVARATQQKRPRGQQHSGVQAKRLAGYAPGWQTLMHGLAQPIMDDTSVEQHLKVGV